MEELLIQSFQSSRSKIKNKIRKIYLHTLNINPNQIKYLLERSFFIIIINSNILLYSQIFLFIHKGTVLGILSDPPINESHGNLYSANLYLIIIKFCQFPTLFWTKHSSVIFIENPRIKTRSKKCHCLNRRALFMWKQSLTFCLFVRQKNTFCQIKTLFTIILNISDPPSEVWTITFSSLSSEDLPKSIKAALKKYSSPGVKSQVNLSYSMAKISDGSALNRELS